MPSNTSGAGCGSGSDGRRDTVVDTNMHVIAGPEEWVDYPLSPLAGAGSEFTVDQRCTPDELVTAMDLAGIDFAFVIASRFHGFDNSYCARALELHGDRFIGIANVDVFDPEAAEHIAHWIDVRGFHGIRFWGGGRGDATWFGDPRYERAWEAVRDLDVPCNAQTTTPAAFPALRRFLERFERVRVTVNNLGHVDAAQGPGSDDARALLSLAEHESLFVNISADFVISSRVEGPPRELLLALLETFGPGRIVWSAFYPSIQERSLAASVRQVKAAVAEMPPGVRGELLGGSALRLYPALASMNRPTLAVSDGEG